VVAEGAAEVGDDEAQTSERVLLVRIPRSSTSSAADTLLFHATEARDERLSPRERVVEARWT
jgi:hypothetical protein